MRFIAITADSAWRTALQTSKTATVNSVFHGAVNLQIASGELLSIFPANSPNAPSGLIASHSPGQKLGAVGETVHLSPTAITFNSVILVLDSCQFVTNRLDHCQLPLPRQHYLEQFAQHLQAQAKKGSFYGAMPGDVFNSAQVARLERGRAQLKQAWVQSASKDIAYATKQLIGLGIGLTPSGDDYLLGLLLVLNHSVACNSINLATIKQAVVDNIKTTTEVSQACLYAGLDCRYSAPLRELFIAITSQNNAFEQALQTVLAHGATSGQDTCVGMLDAWILLQNIAAKDDG
ncbi:DUF2877 domain-containing protein [Psychrobacter sp. TAE2020]|uniref:oxamate carbamoyltransferase subunit AllH family protein n=1 Tax=Psychrobacter sp. TAE2020 TaxID=2846762 RepID=UPI001C0FA824|nr:DUF2877 domain-containing protein [Psychrobacter sp. TAE2020]MBU5615752.1 DUF2877 domain-containing protein [Psychrobacter sp. TAE2020]